MGRRGKHFYSRLKRIFFFVEETRHWVGCYSFLSFHFGAIEVEEYTPIHRTLNFLFLQNAQKLIINNGLGNAPNLLQTSGHGQFGHFHVLLFGIHFMLLDQRRGKSLALIIHSREVFTNDI
jgi:hypothetical protein